MASPGTTQPEDPFLTTGDLWGPLSEHTTAEVSTACTALLMPTGLPELLGQVRGPGEEEEGLSLAPGPNKGEEAQNRKVTCPRPHSYLGHIWPESLDSRPCSSPCTEARGGWQGAERARCPLTQPSPGTAGPSSRALERRRTRQFPSGQSSDEGHPSSPSYFLSFHLLLSPPKGPLRGWSPGFHLLPR